MYVFCGYNTDRDLQSIEKLRIVESCSEQNLEAWEVIETSHYSFPPRRLVVACPLDETRILIMGGRMGQLTYTRKVYELDTLSEQVREFADGGGEIPFFVSHNNASAALGDNKGAIAFVTRSSDFKPCLI